MTLTLSDWTTVYEPFVAHHGWTLWNADGTIRIQKFDDPEVQAIDLGLITENELDTGMDCPIPELDSDEEAISKAKLLAEEGLLAARLALMLHGKAARNRFGLEIAHRIPTKPQANN